MAVMPQLSVFRQAETDEATEGRQMVHMFGNVSFKTHAILTSLQITAMPPYFLTMAIINGFISGSLILFGGIESVVKHVALKSSPDNLALVLPAVEITNQEDNSLHDVESEQRHSCYWAMLKVHSEAKCACFIHNDWYHIPLAWFTVSSAFFLPVMFVFEYSIRKERILNIEIVYVIIMNAIEVLTTIFISIILTKDGKSKRASKISKEIYNSTSRLEKKLLIRLVNSSKDEYPESSCWLFDSPSSILPFLIDTAMLIATTFLTPSD
ncbi:hypothetical protein J6590_074584 [Homalodisca vitripennis]|nr:hypothetical protein J6590_074584 [Homalodisca vitripennis]